MRLIQTSPNWKRVGMALLASTTTLCASGQAWAQDTQTPPATQPADPALPSPPAQAPRAQPADEEEIVVTPPEGWLEL